MKLYVSHDANRYDPDWFIVEPRFDTERLELIVDDLQECGRTVYEVDGQAFTPDIVSDPSVALRALRARFGFGVKLKVDKRVTGPWDTVNPTWVSYYTLTITLPGKSFGYLQCSGMAASEVILDAAEALL